VPVINVSLAGQRSAAVAKTVEGLTRKGHIVVAAAGNDGPAAPPVFPGAYPGVVAVTAVDLQSKVYRYANRGNYIDLSSHGVEVPLIDNGGVPVVATGTSFASPTVARKLARAMTKPDVAAAKSAIAAVEREARDLGAPGRDNIYGHGLVSD
jgi:subtilisin family serine protease